MAVDVCSEVSSLAVSPRISFSHDLKEADKVPRECQNNRRSDAFLLESIDFNFCISQSFSQELLSSADELFANGKILPAQVKKITTIRPNVEKPSKEILRSKPISPCLRRSTTITSPTGGTSSRSENAEAALNFDTKKKSLKEFLSISTESDTETEEEKKPSSKPFWQFRRSSSLNFDSCRTNTLIRSLHFLSRSNSTGSAPNPKPSVLPKAMQKQHSQKEQMPSMKRSNSSAPSSSTNHYFYSYSSSYKSPSRKNYGNGVRISPVLNIPHACISRGTVSLFRFGSLFCNGKSKKKKKRNS